MMKPARSNQPVEFYGKRVTEETMGEFPSLFASQQCPFLKKRCVKQRKSDPSQTIGACTVSFQGGPLVICPHRFIAGNQIFRDCISLLHPPEEEVQYFAVPEITVPGGNVDYFLVATNALQGILDYVAIEIQSLDTTSSGHIWAARQDVLAGKLAGSYPYGINWRMSAKTILVQMLHKAVTFEPLGKKLVLVIQTPFFAYLSNEFTTQHLRDAHAEDTVHFHIYEAVLVGLELQLVLHARKSTTVQGVEQMLSRGRDSGILDEEIVPRIVAKMGQARPIM